MKTILVILVLAISGSVYAMPPGEMEWEEVEACWDGCLDQFYNRRAMCEEFADRPSGGSAYHVCIDIAYALYKYCRGLCDDGYEPLVYLANGGHEDHEELLQCPSVCYRIYWYVWTGCTRDGGDPWVCTDMAKLARDACLNSCKRPLGDFPIGA